MSDDPLFALECMIAKKLMEKAKEHEEAIGKLKLEHLTALGDLQAEIGELETEVRSKDDTMDGLREDVTAVEEELTGLRIELKEAQRLEADAEEEKDRAEGREEIVEEKNEELEKTIESLEQEGLIVDHILSRVLDAMAIPEHNQTQYDHPDDLVRLVEERCNP